MSDWKNVQYKDGKLRTGEGGGGGSSNFAGLDDVSFSNIQNGQVPKYNSTTKKWENADESGGGASALTDLSDVNISSPSDGQMMKYDATTGKWVNANMEISEANWICSSYISANTVLTDSLNLSKGNYLIILHSPYSANGGTQNSLLVSVSINGNVDNDKISFMSPTYGQYICTINLLQDSTVCVKTAMTLGNAITWDSTYFSRGGLVAIKL